jgi:hemerythrin-like domain-containing protein
MTEPAAWMLECHQRIRRFTGGLTRLAALDDLTDPRAPEAAVACARYFREGLPRHAQDEDRSIAPRLRLLADPVLDGVLDRMTSEHVECDHVLARILVDLDAVAAGHPEDVHTLRADARWLHGHMEAHLAAEEAVVVPALALLDGATRASILVEMHARRV